MVDRWNGVECEIRQWRQRDADELFLHTAPYVYLPIKGRMRCSGGAGESVLAPGQAAWWPTAQGLRIRPLGQRASAYVLRFRRSGFAPHIAADADALELCRLLDRLSRAKGCRLPLNKDTVTAITAMAEALEPHWTGNSPERALELKAGGMRFLARLKRDRRVERAIADIVAVDRDPRIDELLLWVEEHLDEDWPIERLAHQCGLARSRFCEVFKRHMGLSPQDHLRRMRVARACRLLRGSAWSVTRIAFESGFGSAARFHAAFKDSTGLAPGQWRRYGSTKH
jgi:AraC-like DNA-binding protein